MPRRSTKDVLREHLPGDLPLHTLEGLEMALDVHYCEELVRAHERGARAMRRRVIAELERWRGNYNQRRGSFSQNERAWWINAARMLLVNRVIVFMQSINEGEDL